MDPKSVSPSMLALASTRPCTCLCTCECTRLHTCLCTCPCTCLCACLCTYPCGRLYSHGLPRSPVGIKQVCHKEVLEEHHKSSRTQQFWLQIAACNRVAFIVMACIVMAHTVVAYIVMADVVMGSIVMAYIVAAYIVMAHIVTVSMGMACKIGRAPGRSRESGKART